MDLTFVVAIGLTFAALVLLALPLMEVARDAMRTEPVATPDEGVMKPSPREEREVEGFVRGRLYGERTQTVRRRDTGRAAAL
jgi:hypothetical protein